MADAAELDVNVDVVVVEFAAGEFERRQRGGGALGGIAVGLGHSVFLLRVKYAGGAEEDSCIVRYAGQSKVMGPSPWGHRGQGG